MSEVPLYPTRRGGHERGTPVLDYKGGWKRKPVLAPFLEEGFLAVMNKLTAPMGPQLVRGNGSNSLYLTKGGVKTHSSFFLIITLIYVKQLFFTPVLAPFLEEGFLAAMAPIAFTFVYEYAW